MNTAIQLTTLLIAIGAGLRAAEASRRHLACVRLEQDLRRGAEGRTQR